jgi:hypothetical protein
MPTICTPSFGNTRAFDRPAAALPHMANATIGPLQSRPGAVSSQALHRHLYRPVQLPLRLPRAWQSLQPGLHARIWQMGQMLQRTWAWF